MKPLRYYIANKSPGFDKELIHIRDNCFVFIDSRLINIVLEHDSSLECHGFNRSAIKDYAISEMINSNVLCAASEDIVNIMMDSVRCRTINDSTDCSSLRCACKAYDGNHYIKRVYCGCYSSVYTFTYSINHSEPVVCIQCVNYGRRNMEGSFQIGRSVIEDVYRLL